MAAIKAQPSKLGAWVMRHATAIGALSIGSMAFGCTSAVGSEFEDEDFASSEAAITGAVRLSQHCSYGGWGASFGPGSYTLSQIRAAGGINDDASSIQIPAGWSVTLYQHDNFTGTSVTLTGDASCLVSYNFNDIVSSMIVRNTGGGGGGSTKRVVAYVPSWNSGTYIPYSKVTHLNIAFAVPNAAGGLTGPDNQTWLRNTVIPTARSKGIRVCVSVGGWMADSPGAGTFDSAISGANRTTLVNNIVGLVNYLGADCADIDYEYVDSGSAGNYDAFINQLDGALGSGKLLTAAVAAFGANAAGFPSSTFDNFDFINLMAYDIRNGQHSSYQDAVDSLNYWTGRGLPASKAVLGLPLYSHTNSGFGPTYKQLYSQNSANACRDSDGVNYWNGIPMIRKKAALARSYGGVMNWELAQDHTSASLVTAMYEAVNGLAGSYSCSGGGGGGGGTNCTPYGHSSAGPCGWWTYSDCCSAAQVCAAAPGCVP